MNRPHQGSPCPKTPARQSPADPVVRRRPGPAPDKPRTPPRRSLTREQALRLLEKIQEDERPSAQGD